MSEAMEDGSRFVRWLEGEVIADARGDRITESPTKPADRLWLGRLAPEETAWKVGKGARAQRLDPCSIGMTFRPRQWDWHIEVGFVVWTAEGEKDPPAARRAGIPKRIHPHAFRHAWMTEMLRRGMNLLQLSRIAGASLQVIQAHHEHLTQDDAYDAMLQALAHDR